MFQLSTVNPERNIKNVNCDLDIDTSEKESSFHSSLH